ncbi:MAG: Eco29kI family restriction endonuclease [Candidatus Didemnitutus sp.]|nr:Eco29kI family restriction endonuclease [Candidatus Didemnitutus sp.]
MPKPPIALTALKRASETAVTFRHELAALDEELLRATINTLDSEALLRRGGESLAELERVLRLMSPQRYGSLGITLGRTDGIAKFFAFSFVTTEQLPLVDLAAHPFWGSGVYAIYYRGEKEPAYAPLSGTETPIYVGKVDPVDAFAESIEAQGKKLFQRLREHARNIAKTDLDPADFNYRAATIQSGMQAAVEEFMIGLFRPIWNKGVGVCHGLGKHGDSPRTRSNKRSPWDTMHPGRKWAKGTKRNQAERHVIVDRIKNHFVNYPVIGDKAALFKRLSLG